MHEHEKLPCSVKVKREEIYYVKAFPIVSIPIKFQQISATHLFAKNENDTQHTTPTNTHQSTINNSVLLLMLLL